MVTWLTRRGPQVHLVSLPGPSPFAGHQPGRWDCRLPEVPRAPDAGVLTLEHRVCRSGLAGCVIPSTHHMTTSPFGVKTGPCARAWLEHSLS